MIGLGQASAPATGLPDGVKSSPVRSFSMRPKATTSPAPALACFTVWWPSMVKSPLTRSPWTCSPSENSPRQMRASESLPECGMWKVLKTRAQGSPAAAMP